jgi:ATP-dependent protease ClpP protease subunit
VIDRSQVAIELARWLDGVGHHERAEAWRRAAGVGLGQVALALRGYEVKAREDPDRMVARFMVEAGTVAHVQGSDGRGAVARWRLEGELLSVPEGWEASLDSPRLELSVVEGRGGDATAALAMLRALDRVAPGRMVARVRGFAASAHAVLFSGFPGRRVIERGARLTFHRPTAFAIGDAAEIGVALAMVQAAEAEMRIRLVARSGGTAQDLFAGGWDVELSAEAAVARGLADAVVEVGDVLISGAVVPRV